MKTLPTPQSSTEFVLQDFQFSGPCECKGCKYVLLYDRVGNAEYDFVQCETCREATEEDLQIEMHIFLMAAIEAN